MSVLVNKPKSVVMQNDWLARVLPRCAVSRRLSDVSAIARVILGFFVANVRNVVVWMVVVLDEWCLTSMDVTLARVARNWPGCLTSATSARSSNNIPESLFSPWRVFSAAQRFMAGRESVDGSRRI